MHQMKFSTGLPFSCPLGQGSKIAEETGSFSIDGSKQKTAHFACRETYRDCPNI